MKYGQIGRKKMIRQKSFDEQKPTLYLVPTPIGNMSEMTTRALDTLRQVDYIACEDTRNSGKLLKAYDIHKPLLSHHEYNQETSIPKILGLLESGNSVAIISDAGYPLVSDPGQKLVRTMIENEIPVVSVSGANAAINALVASGLNTQHYLFYGFLDAKKAKRERQLEELKDFPYTMIFYEAPHRIEEMLSSLLTIFGNRKIVLARELTKLHEEYLRGNVEEILSVCPTLKGEMVVVVSGKEKEENIGVEAAFPLVCQLMESGLKTKQAVQTIAKKYGISKNELYQFVIKNK